jgi:hypothetical protein
MRGFWLILAKTTYFLSTPFIADSHAQSGLKSVDGVGVLIPTNDLPMLFLLNS